MYRIVIHNEALLISEYDFRICKKLYHLISTEF